MNGFYLFWGSILILLLCGIYNPDNDVIFLFFFYSWMISGTAEEWKKWQSQENLWHLNSSKLPIRRQIYHSGNQVWKILTVEALEGQVNMHSHHIEKLDLKTQNLKLPKRHSHHKEKPVLKAQN